MGKNRETFMELVQMNKYYPPLTKKEIVRNNNRTRKNKLEKLIKQTN